MELWIHSQKLDGRSGTEAGRALLQALYTQVVGTPMPEIAIAPDGKPYFPGSPWHFSISHTRRTVFCALARQPVGIDAEEVDRIVPEALAMRILSPGELAQFQQAPDKNRALLTFWVLKEAAAKATGRGIRYPENHTNFSLDDPRVREDLGCLTAIILEEDHAF